MDSNKLTTTSINEDIKKLEELLKKYEGYFAQILSLDKSYREDMLSLAKAYNQAETKEQKQYLSSVMKYREEAYKHSVFKQLKENKLSKDIFTDLKDISQVTLKETLKLAEQWISEFEKENKLKIQADPELMTNLLSIKDLINKTKIDTQSPEASVYETKMQLPVDFSKGAAGWVTQFSTAMEKTMENLRQIVDVAKIIDKDFGSSMETAVNALDGVNNIAEGVGSIFKGDIVSAVNKSITGTYKIFKAFRDTARHNRNFKKEHLKYLDEVYIKEVQYNALLRERELKMKKGDEATLTYYINRGETLSNQAQAIKEEEKALLEKLWTKEYVSEKKYIHGTWFRKARHKDITSSLQGLTYEEMEKLYYEGKFENEVKTLFEQLQKAHQEGKNVEELIQNLQEEVKQTWTGTTSENIVNSITEGFKNGLKSAEDFAESFEELMKTAILQAVKMKYLETPLEQWYNSFAAASEDGLTAEKIADLREQYETIIQNASKELEMMEQLTGISFGKAGEEQAVAQKGLAAMSQDSADELNGRFTALQVISMEIEQGVTHIYDQLHESALQWVEIAENTRYCRKLETMESDMNSIKNDISNMALKGIRLLR